MPRLGDEKEFNKGRLIKERPQEDDNMDDVAIYGSDDDDVVTGDEMDMDGNYDPEKADDNEDFDDASDNLDYGSEEDELGDFEDAESEDDMSSDDSLEDDDMSDDADLEDDDSSMDNGSSKEDMFDQLKDVLQQIVNFTDEGEDVEDMSDEKLGESIRNYYLREDVYLQDVMNEFAESTNIEPADIYKIVNAMESAKASTGSSVNENSVSDNDFYHVVLTKFKDVKVLNIIERVDADEKDSAETDAQTANEGWSKFKKNYIDVLQDPEANLGGERSKDQERQYLEDLSRKHGVISGAKLKEYIRESNSNSRMYVFTIDESLGESFVRKPLKEEDAKSLSNKTRKTKDPKIDLAPFDINKILSSVLAVQFKGASKPYAKIAADMKKGVETAGYKGSQAPARKGDKRGTGDKTADKVEATLALINAITEMNATQVKALVKALNTKTKVSNLVSESISNDLESDFEALSESAKAEGLSEDFLNDVKLIMETAVKTRVDESAQALEILYTTKLKDETKKIQEAITTNLDSYLDYVVDNFMEENKLAIEDGLRTEIAESLLTNVFKVFKEHNVNVPEGKVNLLKKKETEVAKLEEDLQATTNKAMAYKKKAVKWMKEAVVAKHKAGLTLKEGNELEKRALAISEFKDEADFEKKVKDLKRMYFTEKTNVKKQSFINNFEDQEGTLLETVEDSNINGNGSLMDSYVRASKRLNESV